LYFEKQPLYYATDGPLLILFKKENPMFKIILTLVIALAMVGCSATRPVLYPNEHFNAAGRDAAERDIADCMALAESAGANSGSGTAGHVATTTAVGAAIGAATGAVGGAIVGSAGTGAAIGAASGGTAGLLGGIFSRPQHSPAFENFVNKCLQDRGYQPMGWN
jgi:outer membrane lipoprotein SlyB